MPSNKRWEYSEVIKREIAEQTNEWEEWNKYTQSLRIKPATHEELDAYASGNLYTPRAKINKSKWIGEGTDFGKWDGNQWYPPDDIDEECKELCGVLNQLPGIKSTGSCSGHGEAPFNVWLDIDFSKRGIRTLTRAIDNRYHKSNEGWKIVLAHTDVGDQISFVLEGLNKIDPTPLVKTLQKYINGTIEGYNILLDR